MKRKILVAVAVTATLLVATQVAQAEWLTASEIRSAVLGKTCNAANGNRITFGSRYTVKDSAGPTYSGSWKIVNQGIVVNFTKAVGADPKWRPHTKNFGIGRGGDQLYIGTVPMECRRGK